ncbi:HAD-IIIC family phosphatase [Aliikangiella maris]|uniref:HAD-IIIC family phosphatase n=2 Tax=Aliikangiella maris TaxID=3162458 RepID=A0ABV2BUC2_9GAMM
METVIEKASQAQDKIDPMTSTKPVKCVIWDLDNTMWEGILVEGDDVKLKPGIVDIIKALDSKGILQSIASKNNAEDAIKKLEEFSIAEYFLYPEIHWNSKSYSVGKIAESLNIATDTFVFIDDQIFERDEVNDVHPEVLTIDALEYQGLLSLDRIGNMEISDDASKRRVRYLEDMTRKQSEEEFSGTPEEFLSKLDMKFQISRAEEADLLRAEELTLRTNQLNSTGITYDRDDLQKYMNSSDHDLWICELSDTYGSYGKIGLALVEYKADHDLIKLLLMSCRTVSRGVGGVLLSFLMNEAAAKGNTLRADFRRTDRNRQMFTTYQFANFKEISKNDNTYLFENDLSQIAPYPSYIDIVINK